MRSHSSSNEFERLIGLAEFDLDYSTLDAHLADLTQLASRIAGTEISLVNLIDNHTQWTVSNDDIKLQSMPREDSVCQYTILENQSLEIKDLKQDERFSHKNYVTEDPHLRYYFGLPLTASSGVSLGALCVLDTDPNELSPERKELLTMVADQVVRRLEGLLRVRSLQDEIASLKQTNRKVCHDIRNPLSGIIGLASLIKDSMKDDQTEEIVELAEMIEQSSESLLELADSIMNSEDKPETPGENQFSSETFAQTLKELYQPQAKNKGVHLRFRQTGAQDVFFSKNHLLQIVGNLISNSIKFTPKGGEVSAEISLELTGEPEPNRLKVVVQDSGEGMPEAKINQILSGQVDSELGTSGERGYGFGLSLVQHLIQKAHGKMDLSSTEGSGTKFTVSLPV